MWAALVLGSALFFSRFVFAELRALTQVVMPFHERQLPLVKQNLQSWAQFTPCHTASDPVELVLYAAGSYSAALWADLNGTYHSLPGSVKQCFKTFQITFAQLGPSDSYLNGTRLMFERMLTKSLGYKHPVGFILYMEPDCRPVRVDWLGRLQKNVSQDPDPYWVKGSTFRGPSAVLHSPILHNHLHVNGNAIYNVGDDGLRKFYFETVCPFVKKRSKRSAYDTDFFNYILYNNCEFGSGYLHRFQFTDLIQNMWHSTYSLDELLENSPNTVLVHGGNAK